MEKIEQPLYLNPVQMRSYLAYANHEILIAGRGMGKSEGIIAPRIIRWAMDMPQALIIGEAATYQQHFNRTLPGIFAGMERFGWKRDRDYWLGHYAPDRLKIPKPLFKPIRPEYMIHLRTGAAIVLVSHDRPGSANGLSAAAVFGDEAKYLKQEKHKDEVMPAIRGNAHLFGNAPCYGGLLLTSDMPVASSAQWLLDYGDENKNEELITSIIELQVYINGKYNELLKAVPGTQNHKYLKDEISKYTKIINAMRLGNPDNNIPPSFYFHEASSLENIELLRPSYFARMKKDLSPLEYNTSILNKRVKQVKDGFYPHLSDERHGYDMFDNAYLELVGWDMNKHVDMDCRQDLDLDKDAPLDISIDYGGNFNCMVVGQRHIFEYRFLNSLHCEAPKKLRDLVLMFKKYYASHREKTVRFYYDHTAKQNNASNDYLYFTEVIEVLQSMEHGRWTVIDNYIGATPSPHKRYEIWNRILTSNQSFKFKYNRIHCEDWSISCMLAPIKVGSKGYEKDKSSERDKKLIGKRQRATHYSDAGDTLAVAAIYPIIDTESASNTGIR